MHLKLQRQYKKLCKSNDVFLTAEEFLYSLTRSLKVGAAKNRAVVS